MSLPVLQHLTEQLELDLSPLEYMMKCFPEIKEKEEMRKIIGRYGLTGKQQVGLRHSSRLSFYFFILQLSVHLHLKCLPGESNQELVRWSEVPGVFCLAGVAEPSHAVP